MTVIEFIKDYIAQNQIDLINADIKELRTKLIDESKRVGMKIFNRNEQIRYLLQAELNKLISPKELELKKLLEKDNIEIVLPFVNNTVRWYKLYIVVNGKTFYRLERDLSKSYNLYKDPFFERDKTFKVFSHNDFKEFTKSSKDFESREIEDSKPLLKYFYNL